MPFSILFSAKGTEQKYRISQREDKGCSIFFYSGKQTG